MRKVIVYQLDYVDGKLAPVPTGEKAYFHIWGYDFEEFEFGPAPITVAIIEFEDGSVAKTAPELVQFID